MYSSVAVANRFLALARENHGSLTPMQLLKLVYIAHGWTLGLYGRPLIRDEVEAWQYGPVIPRLYGAVRKYRSSPVEGPLRARGGNEELDPIAADIVEQVYGIYGKMTGPTLSRLTHAEGTPWAAIYEPGEFGLTIPNDIIEDHYARMASVPEAAEG